MEKNEPSDKHDGEADHFCSLAEIYVNRDITPGQMATAIETGGCYGWDRFGRFRHSDQSEAIETEALAILARIAAREWSEAISPPDDCLPIKAEIQDSHDSPAYLYGWPERALPEFDELEAPTPRPHPLKGKQQWSYARLLQMLLAKLGLPPEGRHTIAELVRMMEVYGDPMDRDTITMLLDVLDLRKRKPSKRPKNPQY